MVQTQVYSVQDEAETLPGVAVIQFQLNTQGFGPLAEDGHFGPVTDAAVRKFQNARHLTVDGVVGPQTWRALLQEPPTFQVEATLPLINAPSIDTSYVTVGLAAPGGKPKPFAMIQDSGDFECLITTGLAAALGNLPNLGPVAIDGVTGGTEAYATKLDAYLTGYNSDINAVVADVQDNLWGLRFAETRKWSWAWDLASNRLIYYTGKFPG